MAKFSYWYSLLQGIYETLESSGKALCSTQQFFENHCTTFYTKVRCNSTYIFVYLILLCYIYGYTSIKIKPELQKNILKFSYGINYKYEGMLAHLFDRFYVTKFILPTMYDLKLSPINYDKEVNI